MVDKQDININPRPEVNNDLILYRLDEIKGELVDIKKGYVTKAESHALKVEISSLREDIHRLETTTTEEINRLKTRKVFRDTVLWVGLTASAIINIIAMYNLFNQK